jgi:hypothetical protein
MGKFKGALVVALGMSWMVASSASAGVESGSALSTGVVLECSSGKVSMRDRVNVILTRSAGGKITAEVESLSGKRGQAVVARRKVSEKHGPAGALSYKSESGDLVLVKSAKGAKVTWMRGANALHAKVNCRSGEQGI